MRCGRSACAPGIEAGAETGETPRIISRTFLSARAALSLLLALSLFANTACSTTAASRKTVERFPDYLALPLLHGRQGQPLLRAKINGRAALVYLDTGSPVTCVDESQAAAFRLTPLAGENRALITVNANGSDHRVTFIESMSFGTLQLEHTPAVLIDFREINRAIRASREKPTDAILGLETLAGAKAIVDFHDSRLLVKTNPGLPRRAFADTLKAAGWTEIPMHLNEAHLAVDATVNNTRAELLVDTGSPASVLDRAFVRAHPLPLARSVFASSGIHFKDSAVRIGRVESLRLGSFHIRNAPVAVFHLSRLLGLARNTNAALPDGLLGCETLIRCHAYIDCENMKLYLRH